jgi:hypothetical protein
MMARAAHELVQDPQRASPRIIAPQLTHQRLKRRRRPMRTAPRPVRAIRQPANPPRRYLTSHECTDWRDTPTSAATSLTRAPSITAITAPIRTGTTPATREIRWEEQQRCRCVGVAPTMEREGV